MLRFLATALLLLTAPSATLRAGETTICGWTATASPGNPLVLAPSECPPWICPVPPCSCCVDPGAKFGLGVFNTPAFSGATVLFAREPAEFPFLGQTALIDPSSIFATIPLTADPVSPDFANACWNKDDCIAIPPDISLIGVEIFMQAFAVDATQPFGIALSSRVELKIGTLY